MSLLTAWTPALARLMLWLGIGATIGANIAFGAGYGLLGALISAWPAVAFIGSVEIAVQQVRRARVPLEDQAGQPVPEVPGDVEQAVRAAYAASVAAVEPLSQRAMADRFGLSRRKVGQLVAQVTGPPWHAEIEDFDAWLAEVMERLARRAEEDDDPTAGGGKRGAHRR